MRNVLLALAAGSLAVPATLALPTTAAEARDHGKHHKARRYYKSSNGVRYWRGNDGRYQGHPPDGKFGMIYVAGGASRVRSGVDKHVLR
jgi:hypothetical protein